MLIYCIFPFLLYLQIFQYKTRDCYIFIPSYLFAKPIYILKNKPLDPFQRFIFLFYKDMFYDFSNFHFSLYKTPVVNQEVSWHILYCFQQIDLLFDSFSYLGQCHHILTISIVYYLVQLLLKTLG